ncbi:MAG: response regulator transcription factor [Ferruginibacter sp.]
MKTTQPYKIIVVDDHILLRDALANLINNFEEFTVLAKAADGTELLQVIEDGSKPDIVLLDLNMPKMDGYETTKWLRKYHAEIKIVVLTMYDSEMALIRLLKSGVNGFLKKDIHPVELRNALIAVTAGEYYYFNHNTFKIASLFREEGDNKSALEKSILTDGEIEFLKLASTEMPYKEIALAMNITLRGTDNYRNALFKKLEVTTRVGLAIYALKNGIVAF